MASIQARHSRTCALGKPWTGFELPEGCTCMPMYYVASRPEGKLEREKVGKNRRQAERARDKIAVAVDDGVYQPRSDIAFTAWADRWLDALERKQTTIDSYTSTIKLAKEVFGQKLVRRLRPEDVSRFNTHLKELGHERDGAKPVKGEKPLSDSTRAKHLRVLGTCLNSAVQHGYAAGNPVKLLPPAEKPRPRRKESAYFTDDELPVLVGELPAGVYRTLVLVALKTGMRQGELLALEWGDADELNSIIHVRRSVTSGHVSLPKSHERRSVDLTPDVVELLGAWWGEVGKPGDDVLVFPGETPSGYLEPTTLLRRELYPALKRAGIPREGPTGELRTFHSFRHTFARIALRTALNSHG